MVLQWLKRVLGYKTVAFASSIKKKKKRFIFKRYFYSFLHLFLFLRSDRKRNETTIGRRRIFLFSFRHNYYIPYYIQVYYIVIGIRFAKTAGIK